MSIRELYLKKTLQSKFGRIVTKKEFLSMSSPAISKSAEEFAFGSNEENEAQNTSLLTAIYLRKNSSNLSKARRLDIGEDAMATTQGMRADSRAIDRINPQFYAPNLGRMFSYTENNRGGIKTGGGKNKKSNENLAETYPKNDTMLGDVAANLFLMPFARFAHPGSGERIWRPVVEEYIDPQTKQKHVRNVFNEDGTIKRDLDYPQVGLELLSHMISGLTMGFHGSGFDMLAGYRQNPRYQSRVTEQKKEAPEPQINTPPVQLDKWGRNIHNPIGYGTKENGWRPIYQKDKDGKHVHVADAIWDGTAGDWKLDAVASQYGGATDVPRQTQDEHLADPIRERGRTGRPITTDGAEPRTVRRRADRRSLNPRDWEVMSDNRRNNQQNADVDSDIAIRRSRMGERVYRRRTNPPRIISSPPTRVEDL